MKQPEYRSVFSTFINDFIAYKRAGGYKYISEAVYLKQFDDYSIVFVSITFLPPQFLLQGNLMLFR